MFAWTMFGVRKQDRTGHRLARLMGEELEARWVLATYAWAPPPGAASLNFDTVTSGESNWARWDPSPVAAWTRTASVPGINDDIEFPGFLAIAGVNNDQPVDYNIGMTVAAGGSRNVHSVKINNEYTSVITLKSDLRLSGAQLGSELDSSLTMNSATIAGDGGVLILQAGATFEWSGGTLRDLSVLVYPDPGAGLLPAARVIVEDKAAGSGPLMLSSEFEVEGMLVWKSGNVNCDRSAPTGKPPSAIHVRNTGLFQAWSGGTWGTNSNNLVVTNVGNLWVDSTGTATLNGDYTTLGRTRLKGGTFNVNGTAIQQSSQGIFSLEGGTYRAGNAATSALSVWGGHLIGSGTIQGNLILGNPALGEIPVLAPGDTFNHPHPPQTLWYVRGIGSIDVTGTLDMLDGWMDIDVAGPSVSQHDQVRIVGSAALAGKVAGTLSRPHAPFPPGTQIVFLKYAQRGGDFSGQLIPDGWTKDKDASRYWLQPPNTAVRGRAANDADGDGVFEPLDGETVLPGVQVELLDENGEPVVEPTTTDALGVYDFGAVEYGNYFVRFTRPSDLRPVQPGGGSDEYSDSDYDYLTLTAGVTLDESNPSVTNTADALFRPLVAVADTYYTPYRTAVGGNVLDNDPPAAGDTLAVTHVGGPANGTLTLHADGTFTYTPNAGFHGADDTFTYRVTDSYGHTATAVVTVTVVTPAMAEVRGYVWGDADGDGVNDVGAEFGVYGVTVQLLDEAGAVVAEVQTGTGAMYFVFNVLPGTYRVRVLLPEGYGFTAPGADSDVDEYGYSGFFTVTGGEYIDIDAGLLPPP